MPSLSAIHTSDRHQQLTRALLLTALFPACLRLLSSRRGTGSLFTIEQVKDQLFVYDDFNNEFSSEATSLINPVTLEFIEQNKDSAPEVQKR